MTFSIRSIDVGNESKGKCELIIGEHKEVFPLVTTLWGRNDYTAQWMDALQALVNGRVDCCALITDIQAAADSSGVAYWAIFREGDRVYFQERFSREKRALLAGPAGNAAPHIPIRIQGTPGEQSQVSEWTLQIEDIRQFVISILL